jgi:hypothetical protein
MLLRRTLTIISLFFILTIHAIASTYTPISTIAPRSRAQSTTINDLNANTGAAFALLPDETDLSRGTVTSALDTGTADSYLVSLPEAPSGYVDNLMVVMIPLNTNTGASTINVDSLGVVAIKHQNGTSSLDAGDIVAGVPIEMRYSSVTGFFHIGQNGSASVAAAAASAAAALVSENAAAASAAAALVSENAAAASAVLANNIVGDNYYPVYSATDQGDDTVDGGHNTINYYVDLIGLTKQATILLRHNSGSATTPYTLTTSETIPSNITLKVERGAVIDGAGTLTFTQGSNLSAGLYHIFGSSLTIAGLYLAAEHSLPQWWYDGGGDWSAAISAACLYGANGIVYFSEGTYLINSKITLGIDDRWVRILGADSVSTRIQANSVMDAIFEFDGVGGSLYNQFENIWLHGGGKANYAIYGLSTAYLNLIRVQVSATLVSAVVCGTEIVNIDQCFINNNTGNGIMHMGSSNNVANLTNTVIVNNGGIGYLLTASRASTIIGNTIEFNLKTGIMLQQGVLGSVITGNYFQTNGGTGYVYTTPPVTVKSHIIINGSATITNLGRASVCKGIIISGNWTNGLGGDSFIYNNAGQDVIIEGNESDAAFPIVRTHGSDTYTEMFPMSFRNNNGFSTQIGTQDFTMVAYNYPRGSGATTCNISDLSLNRNYFNANFLSHTAVIGGGGYIRRSPLKYKGMDAWMIGLDGGSGSTWGIAIDLDNDYPELKDKWVYYAVATKREANDIVLSLSYSGVGHQISSGSGQVAADWGISNIVFKMASSGTIYLGAKKLGTPDYPIHVAAPVLAVLGANYDSFFNDHNSKKPRYEYTAAPTTGAWDIGDTVWNSAPVAAAAVGWVCTSRVDTQFRIGAAATDTIMEVDATAGMTAGDIVGVTLDNGAIHWTTIASVTDGDTFVLTAGIPAGESAAIDNDIYTSLFKAMANLS